MPHDRKGQQIRKGDTVVVRFNVTEVFPTETACNVNLRAVSPPREYAPLITCNAVLTEKVEPEDPAHAAR